MKLSPDPKFTPEQEVLLWAIRIDHTKDQRVAELLTTGADWVYLRETAIQHGIIPLLYRRLKGEMASLVPANELSILRTIFLANATRNIRMTQHLFKVLDIFADSGIEAMPFKGPVLAVQAYGDLSMRSFGDLDILIHANDVSKAYRILSDHGYILVDPGLISTQKILRIFQRKDLRFTFDNHSLEIHWKIIERLLAVPLDMDQIWDRSLPLIVNDKKIKTLSPEDMIIVMCFHGFKHGGQNLNWIADITYAISHNPNLKWQELFVRAENLGLKRIVLIGLFLAHKHGGIQCEWDIENLFSSEITMQKIVSKIQLNLFQIRTMGIKPYYYLKSRERLRDQILYIIYFSANKVLIVPKWTLRQISRIRLPSDKGLG